MNLNRFSRSGMARRTGRFPQLLTWDRSPRKLMTIRCGSEWHRLRNVPTTSTKAALTATPVQPRVPNRNVSCL